MTLTLVLTTATRASQVLIKSATSVTSLSTSATATATASKTKRIIQLLKCQRRANSSGGSSSSSNGTVTGTGTKIMTSAERNVALRDANEKMKFYYENRPSLSTLNKKKRKFGDDNHHFVMAGVMSTFFCLFLATPMLGKKIAQDDEFRDKYIPSWYNYTVEKPDYAWTRAELHEQMVQLQMDLHERAINGDFTSDKLEEMRRHFNGVDPKKDEHGWGKIHPGVDEDEDIEED